ncbi:CAP domain-containing protein [Halosolutus gelatinilyticus]|uniref:CAP domain-containing protein n=1 Tax=Halosolutus gelatinilyticus TaxID=2931975 RepID=UPI001FF40B15|nr:CAP domain-containing protein [Halosolutus gelatinilyticus]
MIGRPDASSDGDDRSDRALIGSAIRVFAAALLVCAIVLGSLLVAPQFVGDVEIGDVEIGSQPEPSSEPPPAGERNPNVTDPADPGESAYVTDVETVSSVTVEDFVHAEVNDRRAEHGLGPLEWDGTVASVSRAHSADMAQRDYFAHTNPDGEEPYDRFSDVDNYCQGYGENIALTWVDRPVERPGGDGAVEYRTAEALAVGLVDQWMNSSDHRAAILEEHADYGWDRGGVGVYIADDGAVYATHNFCHEW